MSATYHTLSNALVCTTEINHNLDNQGTLPELHKTLLIIFSRGSRTVVVDPLK